MERAIALFADDGGIEFPYFGSVNLPIRYQGPEALSRFFAPVMDGAENFKFKNINIFPGEDENHVSGEYEVDAVIKNTGRRYRQLYGGRLITRCMATSKSWPRPLPKAFALRMPIWR